MPTSARPFRIAIPQSTLDDMRDRLARTRFPDAASGVGWSMGTDVDYLRGLVTYWLHDFDWRAQETRLNELPQFVADVDGVKVHFVHVRGTGSAPRPLVLTHGWPDSFLRYERVIPLLTDPATHGGRAEDAFDVVVPSMPGYGFSERRAMASGQVADLWTTLMTEVLGYDRFFAAGGDVGALVTKALASRHAGHIAGIHLTDVGYPTGQEDQSTMSQAEREFAKWIQGWWLRNGAYAMLHSTRPQSLGPAINDSPAGLAAWILNLIDIGADDHDVESAFGGRDTLLTNITIYWATETAATSAQSYLEEARASYGPNATPTKRSTPPAAVALAPRGAPAPREWAERFVNVQRFTQLPNGGHFLELEDPALYADDVREFFAGVR
jgi:pimeloyl-ACP methyl ester carboxylesterase